MPNGRRGNYCMDALLLDDTDNYGTPALLSLFGEKYSFFIGYGSYLSAAEYKEQAAREPLAVVRELLLYVAFRRETCAILEDELIRRGVDMDFTNHLKR